MVKKAYQATVGKESNTAKAVVKNANVSLKYSTEICKQIKGMNTEKAIAWFERIIKHEEYLPLKRYHKKVAHRRGQAKKGAKAGRYPEKTLKVFIDLMNSVKNNADFKGLDEEKLTIIHAFASKGMTRYSYQAKGRIGGKARRKNATHVEVIVTEGKA